MKYLFSEHLFWVLFLGAFVVQTLQDETPKLPTTAARTPFFRKLDPNRQEFLANSVKKLPKDEGKREISQSPDEISSTTSVSSEWKNLKIRYAAQVNRSLEYLARNTVPVVGPTEPTSKQTKLRPGPGSALHALKASTTKAYADGGLDLPPTSWALVSMKASKNPITSSRRHPTTPIVKPISGYWSTRLTKTSTPPSFTDSDDIQQDATINDSQPEYNSEKSIPLGPGSLLVAKEQDLIESITESINFKSVSKPSSTDENTRLSNTYLNNDIRVHNLEKIISNVSTDDNLVKNAKLDSDLKVLKQVDLNFTLRNEQIVPNVTDNAISKWDLNSTTIAKESSKNNSKLYDQTTTSMTRATNATQLPFENSSTEAIPLKNSSTTIAETTSDHYETEGKIFNVANNTISDKTLQYNKISTSTTTEATTSTTTEASTSKATPPTVSPVNSTQSANASAASATSETTISTPTTLKLSSLAFTKFTSNLTKLRTISYTSTTPAVSADNLTTIGNDIPDVTTNLPKKTIHFTNKSSVNNDIIQMTEYLSSTIPTAPPVNVAALPGTEPVTQLPFVNSTVAQFLTTFENAFTSSDKMKPENLIENTTKSMETTDGRNLKPLLDHFPIIANVTSDMSSSSEGKSETDSDDETMTFSTIPSSTIPTTMSDLIPTTMPELLTSTTNLSPVTTLSNTDEEISTTIPIISSQVENSTISFSTSSLLITPTSSIPDDFNNTIRLVTTEKSSSSESGEVPKPMIVTEKPTSSTQESTLEKSNEIKSQMTKFKQKSTTEHPVTQSKVPDTSRFSPSETTSAPIITQTRNNDIRQHITSTTTTSSLTTTEVHISIPKSNLSGFHYDLENKSESTPIIFQTAEIDDDDTLMYNTTNNEKIPNVESEIDGEDDDDDLEKEMDHSTNLTPLKPSETTTEYVKETTTFTSFTTKIIPVTETISEETNVDGDFPSTEMDEPTYDITDVVPTNIQLLVQASLKQMCLSRDLLRDSVVKVYKTFGDRSVNRKQVVILNLGPQECGNHAEMNMTPVYIRLLLTDSNGQYDRELTDLLFNLFQEGHFDFKFPVSKVDKLINQFNIEPEPKLGGTVIAAIVISSIAATCLLFLTILLVIMRKRQKGFNYGQRCTPVSLDDYSLDNISVYNSVRARKALRASKRSYGNPAFDDPVAMSNPLNFAGLANAINDKAKLEDEFSKVPLVTVKMDELPIGAEIKNRYANVIPLPETRVHINTSANNVLDQFINANYVKGAKGADKFYIACQAPLQNTISDFWQMIWEQQSRIIIMLTDLHENGVEKCADYLPPSEVLDCHRVFGDLQITLKKREAREKYIISSLQVKNLETNLWREVTHLWYISWPARGIPDDQSSIIAFLIEARSFAKSGPPVVVHCSPGTGRTGTIIAIDIAIRDFETDRIVDIPKTVYNIRRERAGAVQTTEQYKLIYEVLHLYATKLTGGGLDSI